MTSAHKAHCSPPGPLPRPLAPLAALLPVLLVASWQPRSPRRLPSLTRWGLPLLICCPLLRRQGQEPLQGRTGTLSLRHGTPRLLPASCPPYTPCPILGAFGLVGPPFSPPSLFFFPKSLKRSGPLCEAHSLCSVSQAFIPACSLPPLGSLLGLPTLPPTYSF